MNSKDVVGHFNISSDLITQIDKKIDLAKLNLIAGRKAKAAIAYEASLAYFHLALDLLPDDIWQVDYDLSLALHEGATEISYLCKKMNECNSLQVLLSVKLKLF